jgi:hypothetical protein
MGGRALPFCRNGRRGGSASHIKQKNGKALYTSGAMVVEGGSTGKG